jgi:hypothetical protein
MSVASNSFAEFVGGFRAEDTAASWEVYRRFDR